MAIKDSPGGWFSEVALSTRRKICSASAFIYTRLQVFGHDRQSSNEAGNQVRSSLEDAHSETNATFSSPTNTVTRTTLGELKKRRTFWEEVSISDISTASNLPRINYLRIPNLSGSDFRKGGQCHLGGCKCRILLPRKCNVRLLDVLVWHDYKDSP